jgi:hypothetical protein
MQQLVCDNVSIDQSLFMSSLLQRANNTAVTLELISLTSILLETRDKVSHFVLLW